MQLSSHSVHANADIDNRMLCFANGMCFGLDDVGPGNTGEECVGRKSEGY
jgi:hypothetical protein